jgi:hypothetical protein
MVKLAAALTAMGHPIGADTVGAELAKLGFSRQSNRKADEGSRHPDRDAQFEHINAKVVAAQGRQQPVISVDTKKKELLGNFKNGETDYRPKGDPRRVNVHDFEDKKLGKVVPYGVYDVTANAGFVSVGITSDTAEFAVASIRCWLERMGRQRYPQARELTITADCGGSNGSRVRLWKLELQKLAEQTGLAIHVHHYPPGTSQWNKIEHRLFCHITQNWRPTAQRSSRGGRVDWRNRHQRRPQGRKRAGHAPLPKGRQSQQRRDETPRHHTRSIPSRMELYDQPQTTLNRSTYYSECP